MFRNIFFFLLNLGFITHLNGEAGWNDPNIVHQQGEWRHIPDDYYDRSKTPQPPAPYDDKYKRNDTSIIVLIAAFRETRCKDTLFSFYTKAAHPSRVFIGLVQQNKPHEDDDCVYAYCQMMFENTRRKNGHNNNEHDRMPNDNEWNNKNCPFYDNIKVNRLLDTDAKGPVYARALQSELVETEDFCMQIDAHSEAAQGWDVLMLREWGKCDNEYGIITTYPSNIKDIGRNSNKHWEMPHLCEANIAGMGAVHNGRARAAANLQRPILAPLWAAGLSFSRCHAEKRVPNDINLKHVFTGEEYSRGARLWTHGYDFYSPTRAHIGTWYQSQKGNKGSWRVNHEELQKSNQRMGTLLKFENSDQSIEAINALGKYGIGNERTLEQYFEYSGVNTHTRQVNMDDKCIIKWVPWDDSNIKNEIIEMNGLKRDNGESNDNNNGIDYHNLVNDEINYLKSNLNNISQNAIEMYEKEKEMIQLKMKEKGWNQRSALKFVVQLSGVMWIIAGLAAIYRFRHSLRKKYNDFMFKSNTDDHIL